MCGGEVMMMWFLILFMATVVTISALAVWSVPPANRADEAVDGRGTAGKPAAGPPAAPESLEGVLVAQLMSGEISKTQYHRAVEGMAARDDDRHPLAVPPEAGPAAAG
jgi:hypothetical protein